MKLMVLTIVFMSISLALIMVKIFILKPLEDSNRFRLFKLRDDLCTLAMENKVDCNSGEYIFLINCINQEIMLTGRGFSITKFIENIVMPQLERENLVKILINNINENEYMKPIAAEFFLLSFKRISKKLKFFQYAIYVIYVPVKAISCFFKDTSKHNQKNKKYCIEQKQRKFYASMSENVDKYKDIISPVLAS